MQKLILIYETYQGDGVPKREHTTPLEYSGQREALEDFEKLFNGCKYSFEFCGENFDKYDFIARNGSYSPPEIYPLDHWFVANRIKP